MITLLDYGVGNVRSVINGIERLGERVKVVASGEAWIAAPPFAGRAALRACVCSDETDESDLDALVAALARARSD